MRGPEILLAPLEDLHRAQVVEPLEVGEAALRELRRRGGLLLALRELLGGDPDLAVLDRERDQPGCERDRRQDRERGGERLAAAPQEQAPPRARRLDEDWEAAADTGEIVGERGRRGVP